MTTKRLNQILDVGGLSTRVQPIVELAESTAAEPSIHGVECLNRGPAGSTFESANVLFDYVRRKQAETIVDRECIALSLRSVKVLANVRLFLNVHASTLGRDQWFAGFLQHQADANGIDLRRLTLEILEHSGHADHRLFMRNIRALQDAGVSFALDDLGLQYCNFGMLLDVEPAYLKLDMQLVRGCHSDPRRKAILRSINQIGLDIGAKVIAEGVERADELNAVADMGIRHIQGFFFLPPVWPDDFLRTSWGSAARGIANPRLIPALLLNAPRTPVGAMENA